jgi:hypothetical protein
MILDLKAKKDPPFLRGAGADKLRTLKGLDKSPLIG